MSSDFSTREMLEARISDASAKSRKGQVAWLPFLNPREVKQAERILSKYGLFEQAWFWGGYDGAERACLFLLPDYLTSCLSAPPMRCDPNEVLSFLSEEISEAVDSVRIIGSGYRTLNHRDYLGAILRLGLERDAIGDVAVQNEHEAVVFCSHKIATFLTSTLERVASDKIRCVSYLPDEHFTDGRSYAPMSETVAAPRLDCVVAALTRMSREAAQSAVRSGLVEVDFEPCERTELMLSPPVSISVRGYGRFILRSFDGETRKGRLRMRADRLV